MLSFNYIPANFEAVLIGPSTASNINTQNIRGLKIYNLAINGGNITEVKALLMNYLKKRTPKLVIIGMYPYLLQGHGMKTSYISPRSYWSALGSVDLFKRYALGIIRRLKNNNPYNSYGHYHYLLPNRMNASETISSSVQTKKFHVNIFAYLEYLDLVSLLRESDTRILLYNHPVPDVIYKSNKYFFDLLFYMTKRAMKNTSSVIDFNNSEFLKFTTDYSNFQDDGHLSDKGARAIEWFLDKKLQFDFVSAVPQSQRSFSPTDGKY